MTFPAAKIIWLKNSEILESSGSSQFTIISDEFSSKIIFDSCREFDGSTLSVKATNESGEAYSESKIYVLCKFLWKFFHA